MLQELLESNGLAKLQKRLNQNHFDLDVLKEVVKHEDTYMKEIVRGSCNISHMDMDRLEKAILHCTEQDNIQRKKERQK